MSVTIERTDFGEITIGEETYCHDVVVRLSGEVKKRKKKLSKNVYGTSHKVSLDEAKYVYEKGCRAVVVGTGQHDGLRLSKEAEEYLSKKGCEILMKPTPQAVVVFNKTQGPKVGLFHVTC